MKFITEGDIEKALDYLRDNAAKAAQARANRIYMEEYRKVVKAQIMGENNETTIGAQERFAYADARYIEHLEAMRTSIFEDEKHRFTLAAAQAKIDAWQTMSANERAMKI
jgi:translation elongation factor EF-Ts